jgi:hypothetical protein
MRALDDVFEALKRSPFRRRFRLGPRERAYVADKGLDTVRRHAADFVAMKLVPAYPKNDGKQTPMRGHPVFIAQHATATCCRGCLEKWHGIKSGHALSEAEVAHVLAAIDRWIGQQLSQEDPGAPRPSDEPAP